jgi:hypothetical protein
LLIPGYRHERCTRDVRDQHSDYARAGGAAAEALTIACASLAAQAGPAAAHVTMAAASAPVAYVANFTAGTVTRSTPPSRRW